MLQANYVELCERRGWKVYEDSQKAAIKQICFVLQPLELKNRVIDGIKLEKMNLKMTSLASWNIWLKKLKYVSGSSFSVPSLEATRVEGAYTWNQKPV